MSDTLHPMLPPATPLLRRTTGVLQVGGVDSTDGLLVDPSSDAVTTLLQGLDGRRPQHAVLSAARESGLAPDAAASLLDGLRAANLLVDLQPADLLAADAGSSAAARTAVELPAARSGAGEVTRWATRRQATVVVVGATRVGVPLAAMLAASGVGRVSVSDPGLVGAGDVVVGGLTTDDEGRPRAFAAADAIRRAAPLADVRPTSPVRVPDLAVLTAPWAAVDPLVVDLHRAGTPHLVATVRGETGIVGPCVVPGISSCLECAERHRRDADPGWPTLAAQLASAEPRPSGSTMTCLSTALLAAQQALAYLDGSGWPTVLDATVELRPPDLLPRRRLWPRHPDCDCLQRGSAEHASSGRAPRRAERAPSKTPVRVQHGLDRGNARPEW